MSCSIESVTVGVGDLESSLQFFRDRLGMRVVNDTRASVGLVAAWRRPVHESVRLVDLASAASSVPPNAGGKRAKPVPASAKTLPPGRLRLAVYEDYVLPPASRDAPGDKTVPPISGPWAIELSRGGADAGSDTRPVQGPDGLWIVGTGAPTTEGSARSDASGDSSAVNLSAVWISSANVTASTRFYTEALGLRVLNDSRPPIANNAQLITFGSNSTANPKIVIASVDSPTAEQQPAISMAVGQLGFNLITMRCDDLDELQKRLEALAIKPITEPAHVGMPFGYPGRVMIVAGPNGELFEFDEQVV